MKSKSVIILFLTILILDIFYPAYSDEFNFKVTELEITENANIIKSINGGVVNTKNEEITIKADNFTYNKLTTLLEAEGNVRLVDKVADVVIESNQIFYLKNKEEIYTKGKSVALNGSDIQIDADQYFKYNKLTSIMEAKGNVKLDDKNENVIIYTNEIFYFINEEKIFTLGKTNIDFEDKYNMEGSDLTLLRNEMILSSKKDVIIVDSESNTYKLEQFQYSINQEILKGKNIVAITSDKENKSDEFFFKTGFFDLKKNEFLGKDITAKFHKDLFGDNENDPRISAVSGFGDKINTYFKKGVFTSCKKTDKCPPWKITSDEIHHDKIKKQINYKNAWLEIYDFPVVYFPKFFHPDPSVKRQSGLLMPEFGSSNNLGSSVYVPYFLAISDDKDLTIKPRLFNDNKFLLQNEYRQKTKNSITIADFSFVNGHDSSSQDKGGTRSHLFTNTLVDLSLDNFKKSMLQINYQKVSNDNYLKLFDLQSPLLLDDNSVLESKIQFDLEHKSYDLTTSFEMYENLNGANSDRYQYVLPSYDFSKNFSLNNIDGSFNLNSYGNNTLTDTNVVGSTVSNDLIYSALDKFFNNGIKTNFEISLKNINTVGKNNPVYKNSPQSELMSAYTYNASLPLIKKNSKTFNTLEPKLSLRFSPHEMKNNRNESRRIDISNVFSSNRLSLGNSFESGESVTLGLNFKKEKINANNKIDKIEEYIDFKLASVFRLDEEKNIPTSSTLNKKNSNIFGEFNFKPTRNISLGYNFSLTDDLNTFEYNSLITKMEFGNFITQFDYLEERGAVGSTNLIQNTTKYNFDNQNSISFNTRRNRKLDLTEYYDLVYEYKNDCLVAGIKYKKNYYNDADIKPVEELFFSITIVPLGTFSPDKMALK
ncbi:organic solvent tolerance protein [Candidatus Pelagibacter ubique]|nr:organic solvent tolerance protein [Candidatus Pelagibacter ubique]